MSAAVKQTKNLTTLDLAIRTLKPRTASETSEKQEARVVVVTNF